MHFLKKLKLFVFAEDGSLKDKAIRSGFWLTLSGFLNQGLGIFRSIILARLLTPEIFGLMGLCLIFIRGIDTFTRPGFAIALIHRKDRIEEAKYTAFTLLVVRGILLALIVSLLSPWIAQFYEREIIQNMLIVLSISFLLLGFGNVNSIIQQKELNFRRLAYHDQVSTLLSTITVILIAYFYRNVWALVYGYVITQLIRTISSYIFIRGTVKFSWDTKIAKELFAYGKYVTGASIILYIATELDNAVIGKIIGVEELGYYVLAFTTANMATTYVSKLLSRIMFPAYSKLQDNPVALRDAYLNVFSIVVAVIMPVAVTIMLFAPEIMLLVYGEKWLPAAEPLQILCIFGVIRAMSSLSGYFLNGVGKPSSVFKMSMGRLFVMALLIYPLTLNYGLSGAAYAATIAITIQLIVGIEVVKTVIQLTYMDILRKTYKQLFKTFLVLITLITLDMYIEISDLVSLLLIMLLGGALYFVMSYRYVIGIFKHPVR